MSLLTFIPGGPWVRGLVVAAALAAVAGAATYAVHRYNEGVREEGRGEVRAQVLADQARATADKFKTDEKLRRNNEAIDQTLQTSRAARQRADGALADSLRQLDAALARAEPGPPDPAPGSRADAAGTPEPADGDDPRPRIARECAAALATLDARNRRLVDEKTGLQRYANDVCLAAGQAATAPDPRGQSPPD